MNKSKYLDLAGLTAYDGKIKEWIKSGIVDITNEAINALFPVVQPNNEIWYTSKDGNVVTPYRTYEFGAKIVSNTYENGKGVITFDGPVTRFGGSAFKNCSSLTSVTIPNSVTSIRGYAFIGCSSLPSITIPNSVTSIGEEAFRGCKSLTSITIGNGVTSIEKSTFYECSSLASVAIPNSVTSIGGYAFCRCEKLISITIPDSVTSIGDYAFSLCDSLNSIDFQGTMEQWNAVSKSDNWNIKVPAIYVQCSDGQVAL